MGGKLAISVQTSRALDAGYENSHGGRAAFTLIEVLIVVAILGPILAILLPGLAAARQRARLVQCASNLRQLGQGFFLYATEHSGRLPPNLESPAPGHYWCDSDHVGAYFQVQPGAKAARGVFACPSDPDGLRSYSMNVWASSGVDGAVAADVQNTRRFWGLNSPQSSRLILLVEAWSSSGVYGYGWYANEAVGFAGDSAADRFGAGAGIVPPMYAGRWGLVNCELAYVRHRQRDDPGVATAPHGRVNLGYADGHVALKSDYELTNFAEGGGAPDSLWSPTDADLP